MGEKKQQKEGPFLLDIKGQFSQRSALINLPSGESCDAQRGGEEEGIIVPLPLYFLCTLLPPPLSVFS